VTEHFSDMVRRVEGCLLPGTFGAEMYRLRFQEQCLMDELMRAFREAYLGESLAVLAEREREENG